MPNEQKSEDPRSGRLPVRNRHKAVVIGGTGLVGTGVVRRLAELGYDALPATPRTGVDVSSGRGLTEALEGAVLVVDASNPSSFDEVMEFFTTGTRLAPREHVAVATAATTLPSRDPP
jgi:uncharacterized protein YbjT (DUF2867 family)